MKQKQHRSLYSMHIFCISVLITTQYKANSSIPVSSDTSVETNLPFCPGLPQCRSGYMYQGKRRESAPAHASSHECVQSPQSTVLHFSRIHKKWLEWSHASCRSTWRLGNVSFSHTLIALAHMNQGTVVASCPGNDVANDASLLPTNICRLCTWLQCLLSKELRDEVLQ